MLDSKHEARVKAIVEDWVESGQMFTAYDVTKVLRTEVGTSVHINHFDVRKIVNDMWFDTWNDYKPSVFNDSNYNRTLADLPKAVAWVYHHSLADYMDYDPNAVKKPDSIPTFLNPIQDDNDTDDTDNNTVADVFIGPDKRGRICVPKKALNMIHAKPGDKVLVTPGNDCVLIKDAAYGTKCPGDTYIVDKSNNVRIRPYMFKKANMDVVKVGLFGVQWKVVADEIILETY